MEILEKLKESGMEDLDLMEFIENTTARVVNVIHDAPNHRFIFGIKFDGDATGTGRARGLVKIDVDENYVRERMQ